MDFTYLVDFSTLISASNRDMSSALALI